TWVRDRTDARSLADDLQLAEAGLRRAGDRRRLLDEDLLRRRELLGEGFLRLERDDLRVAGLHLRLRDRALRLHLSLSLLHRDELEPTAGGLRALRAFEPH